MQAAGSPRRHSRAARERRRDPWDPTHRACYVPRRGTGGRQRGRTARAFRTFGAVGHTLAFRARDGGARRQHTTDFLSHVYFVRLDGSIEGEITPTPGSPLENYLCGLGYRAGRLYASACDDQIYAMDLAGNVDATAPALVAAEATETIAFDDGGGLHTSGYESAILRSYDAAFARRASLDVDFSVGFGVSAGWLTHDADTGELLITTRATHQLVAIRDDLRSARALGDPNSHGEMFPTGIAGLSYLGGGTIAIAHRNFPRGVEVYHWPDDTIPYHLIVNCCEEEPDPFPPGPAFAPTGVAPWGGDAFLVSVAGDHDHLKVVTRTGTPIDLFPTALRPSRLADLPLSAPFAGAGVQAFDAGAGTRVLAGDSLYDGGGALVHVFDAGALGLTDGLSGVAWLGGDRYVTVDGDTSTLVIFTSP